MKAAAAALTLAAVAAAFALVKTRFEARHHQAELTRLQNENVELRHLRSQLLIEMSTFSDPAVAHQAGLERLDMRHPSLADGTLIYLRD